MSVQAVRWAPPKSHPGAQPTPSPMKPLMMPPLDLQGLLQLAQSQRRQVQQTAAESEVRSIQGHRDTQTREARAAQERAEQEAASAADANDSAAFWKKCAVWAGAVAAVAATACTMGSAAPLAVVAIGVALSVSSPYIGQGVARATGSEKAGQWTTIGCAVAGAVIQFAGGGMSSDTPATVYAVAAATQATATGVGGVATTVQVVKTNEAKRHEAAAEERRADAIGARALARRTQSQMDDVVEELKALEGSIRRALDAIGGIGRELKSSGDRAAMHLARSC
jgi:hypothetical protein